MRSDGEDPQPASIPPFQEFIARHEAAMERRARNLCRGHLDPAEVVQSTRILAFRSYHQLRDAERGLGWLLRILQRAFLDLARRQQAGLRDLPIEAAEDKAAPEDEAAPVWDRVTPRQFLACIERLPDEYRECYRLRALEGLDYNEIVTKLGIPKNTVGTRLLRARKLLRPLLLAELGEEAP